METIQKKQLLTHVCIISQQAMGQICRDSPVFYIPVRFAINIKDEQNSCLDKNIVAIDTVPVLPFLSYSCLDTQRGRLCKMRSYLISFYRI